MIENYAYTSTIWPSLLTVFLMLAMALYSARHRNVPGVLPFMIGCLFAAAWAAGAILEYSAVNMATKIFWIKFQAAWQLPTSTVVTCFVLEYTWPGRWLTRRNIALLSIAPLLVLGMILSDGLYHWFWRGFSINGSVTPLLAPGSWVAIIYSYGLAIINLIVLSWLFRNSPQHRWPVGLMVVGHIGVRAIYIFDKINLLQSTLPLDIIGLAFVNLMYAIALYGFRIFNPIPLARLTAIAQMREGMLVLDMIGRVVSLNPAAERIFDIHRKHLQGKPIRELLSRVPELSLPLSDAIALSRPIEVKIEAKAETRCYELDFSSLRDFRGHPVGYLLLMHNVTEQRQSQGQIIEQQRSLAMLQERERLARELHDELSQELSFINIQAQAIVDLLAAGHTEQASSKLLLLAKVARETQVDVRGQISKLSFDFRSHDGFVAALRRFTKEFERMYGIPAEIILSGDPANICLEPTTELQLLLIVQEAFTNVRKHACAKSIRVCLDQYLRYYTLSIQDDGVGFISNENPTGRCSFGLQIMAERAAEIGGNLEVQSTPDQGTHVMVEVPVMSRR